MNIVRILFGLLWLVGPAAWAADGVHLILSEMTPAYQEAAQAFAAVLGDRHSVRVWPLNEVAPDQLRRMTLARGLVVPVGAKAARFVEAHHGGRAATLSLMLPWAVAEQLDWPGALAPGQVAAVLIDQPATRYLDAIQAFFPLVRHVGVLVTPENLGLAKAISREAVHRELAVKLATVDRPDNLSASLRQVLTGSEVLLLPDAQVINPGNVQYVLMTAYRAQVPTVGYSQGVTKSGALFSVYSSPAQMGRQGGKLALSWLEGGEFSPSRPSHHPPAEFFLAFNPQVARSLSMPLVDVGALRKKLGATD